MTEPQKKALCATYILHKEVRHSGFSRYQIGSVARGSPQGYPLMTMYALWREGLVEPVDDHAAHLVETKQCSCGCDRWRITSKGIELVSGWNIRMPFQSARDTWWAGF